jgi:outer membrane protein TolC
MRLFIASLLVATTTAAVAGPNSPDAAAVTAPRAISLREAISYARAHQPSLAAARARVEVARGQAQIPRAAWSPRVTAGAELLVGTNNNTTASYGGPLGFDVPRIGGTPANAKSSLSPEPSTLAGVGVRQEVYDFGRISAQTDALDLFAHAAEEDAQTADLDLVLFVEESFYAVQGAHAIETAANAAVKRAQEHRDFANANVTAQLRPPIELTRAEADLARRQAEQVRAEGALRAAQQVLAAAIGAADPALDAGNDDLAYAPAPTVDLADLDRRIPSLRAAIDALRGQQALTKAISAELRPDLSLSAGVTGRAGGTEVATNPTPAGAGWVPDVPNWDALVVISWPLFDKTVDARADVSRRLERVRAEEVDAEREQLRAKIAGAYEELEVAVNALPALQRAVDAATANQKQADARFSQGLGTAVELADAEALLTDTQIQLAVGQFQRARARARLARVIAEVVP